MKKVSIKDLKEGLSSVIAEAQAGTEIIITRHNKPVARLTAAGTEQVHRGAQFGSADLKPAVRGRTAGRYLEILGDDRHAGRER